MDHIYFIENSVKQGPITRVELATPILDQCHGDLKYILEHFFPQKWKLRSVCERIHSITHTCHLFRCQ